MRETKKRCLRHADMQNSESESGREGFNREIERDLRG